MAFLARNRIVDKGHLRSAPYILSSLSGNLPYGRGFMNCMQEGEWVEGVINTGVFY